MDGRTTTFAALRAAPQHPLNHRIADVPLGVVPAGATAVGTGLAFFGHPGLGAEVTLWGAALPTLATSAWWWARDVIRPQGTKGHLVRSSVHAQRSGGVASWIDIQELASPAALRRRAAWLRPSVEGVRRLDPRQVGALVAVLGLGRLPGQQVWTSCEDITLRVGGPRMGKSATLICYGLDAPGALLTTSTKLDLAEGVHMARCGPDDDPRPVHLLNITNEGKVPSTVRWSVLTGCTDYGTAARRAADLIPGHSRDGDLDWNAKAREILGLLIHAAAVDGRRARDIQAWMNADQKSPYADHVFDVLSSVPGGGPERADQWRAHLAEPDKTRGSVIATMRPALAWIADDMARDLGDADPETVTLNIPRFITEAETLHIVGREDKTGLAPLIAAIVAEVAFQARRIAGESPGGRLDPPLTMLLDEAAIICPVPLDTWSADMGGRNITLHVSIQSLAQMRGRWGKEGASTILGNVGSIIVFGGSKDADDLTDLSTLTGEHRMRVLNADWTKEGDVEHRWVPVMTPAEISALRPFQVLVLKSGMHAVIGWAPAAKDRRGWKRSILPGDPRHAERCPLASVPIPEPEEIRP